MSRPADFIYILCALCFILGLKLLSSPVTARRGNLLSALGMLVAVVVTLFDRSILDLRWIAVGLGVGAVAGAVLARWVAMTSMPQMVAVLNGFGGLASVLVAWDSSLRFESLGGWSAGGVVVSILVGGITFTGSMVAWAKLNETLSGRPLLFPGQTVLNAILLVAALGAGVWFVLEPGQARVVSMVALASVLGILAVIPIGGADMPVVISLLNSYSGLAACATGFVLGHPVLVVTGSLVGASGLILTRLMCKAMNRSLGNVLFSGFGAVSGRSAGVEGSPHPISIDDTYVLLEAARSVVVVPGYGLAVAQAQHALHELGQLLEANGADVRFAIHPVAGRMPGHMNVLLAEASVPYESLIEMDAVNPTMPMVDVCLVIGANDVVNPAAGEDRSSPIYGMPIIHAEAARTVVILKRSMGTGFAGVANPLFVRDNARMLFGDARASIQALVAAFKK